MSARTLVPVALVCALSLALLLVQSVATDPPMPGHGDRAPPAEVADEDVAAPRYAPLEDAVWHVPDDAGRVELPVGVGRLRVLVVAGGPPQRHPAAVLLRAEPEQGGDPIGLEPRNDGGFEIAVADAPARRYRLTVVRGPGDRADAEVSRFWTVDPPTDRVAVAAGTTTGHTALVVGRDGAPERGTATIRGMATLDGRPAESLVVRGDPLSGSRVAHVSADGSFVLDDVPAGLVRVELCSRIRSDSIDGGSIVVYAVRQAAPPPGGVAIVELHAATVVLEGSARLPKDAASNARVELSGEPFSRALGSGDASFAAITAPVDGDGRFRFDGLPSGSYRLRAVATDAAAAPVELEIPPGAARFRVDVTLRPRVPVGGTVELSDLPEPRGRSRRLAVRFRGPVVEDARVEDGRFLTNELIPGRYDVVFLGRGRGFGTAEPVRVGEDGAVELRLVPIRR